MFRSRSLGNMQWTGGGEKGAHYTAIRPRYHRNCVLPQKKAPPKRGLPPYAGVGREVRNYGRRVALIRNGIGRADGVQERDVVRGFRVIVAGFAAEHDRVRDPDRSTCDRHSRRPGCASLRRRDGVVGAVDVVGRHGAREHINDVAFVEIHVVVRGAIVDRGIEARADRRCGDRALQHCRRRSRRAS